jgi:Sec-independent protein translocase protein TatA
MLGGTELLVLFGVILFLFGHKFVVSWARSLGETKKELNKLVNEDED